MFYGFSISELVIIYKFYSKLIWRLEKCEYFVVGKIPEIFDSRDIWVSLVKISKYSTDLWNGM